MLSIIKKIKQEWNRMGEETRKETERREKGKVPVEIEFRIFLRNGEMLGPIIYRWEYEEAGQFL